MVPITQQDIFKSMLFFWQKAKKNRLLAKKLNFPISPLNCLNSKSLFYYMKIRFFAKKLTDFDRKYSIYKFWSFLRICDHSDFKKKVQLQILLQIATEMLQNIIKIIVKTKKLFKKQKFEIWWFDVLMENFTEPILGYLFEKPYNIE